MGEWLPTAGNAKAIGGERGCAVDCAGVGVRSAEPEDAGAGGNTEARLAQGADGADGTGGTGVAGAGVEGAGAAEADGGTGRAATASSRCRAALKVSSCGCKLRMASRMRWFLAHFV